MNDMGYIVIMAYVILASVYWIPFVFGEDIWRRLWIYLKNKIRRKNDEK